MRTPLTLLLLPLPLGLLAGCASDTPAPPATATSRHPPPVAAAPLPQLMGGEARALIAQFGPPILDQREGPARKLQFRSAACVLDAYLYPPAGGGTPRVTWIDTRNPQGNDMDHTSCIAALIRR